MAHIPVKNLQEGMVLSADVCDQNGRFLIGSGCELSEKHIRALQSWGIAAVEVEGDESCEEITLGDAPEELRQQIEEQVKDKFQYTNIEHPFMKALYDEAISFHIRQQLKQQ